MWTTKASKVLLYAMDANTYWVMHSLWPDIDTTPRGLKLRGQFEYPGGVSIRVFQDAKNPLTFKEAHSIATHYWQTLVGTTTAN